MSERPLPKTLQAFITKHHHEMFDEGWSEQDGFNERDPYNGWAHWIYLKKGWCYPEHGAHIIHEDNVKACKDAFKDVRPCDCDDCKK